MAKVAELIPVKEKRLHSSVRFGTMLDFLRVLVTERPRETSASESHFFALAIPDRYRLPFLLRKNLTPPT